MLSITDSKDVIIAPVPCPYNKKYKNFYKKKYIVINLNGSQKGNSVSKEKQIEILQSLSEVTKLHFIVFSNKILFEAENMQCLYPKSILDAAAIIRKSVCTITTDTSIMHISSSFKVNTIILMNNEKWRNNFIPLFGNNIIIKSPTEKISDITVSNIKSKVHYFLDNYQ